MQAITFLKEIEQFQSPVLSFNDVIRIIGKSKEYSRVYIHRLKQKNIITEIEKGKYALSEEPFEIASNLVFPSYISFMGAYYIYGFTTQIPIIAHKDIHLSLFAPEHIQNPPPLNLFAPGEASLHMLL